MSRRLAEPCSGPFQADCGAFEPRTGADGAAGVPACGVPEHPPEPMGLRQQQAVHLCCQAGLELGLEVRLAETIELVCEETGVQ